MVQIPHPNIPNVPKFMKALVLHDTVRAMQTLTSSELNLLPTGKVCRYQGPPRARLARQRHPRQGCLCRAEPYR